MTHPSATSCTGVHKYFGTKKAKLGIFVDPAGNSKEFKYKMENLNGRSGGEGGGLTVIEF